MQLTLASATPMAFLLCDDLHVQNMGLYTSDGKVAATHTHGAWLFDVGLQHSTAFAVHIYPTG
jgi:hypothetical protein